MKLAALVLSFCVSVCQAAPDMALKVRAYPIMKGLTSTVLTGKLNWGLGADAELFLVDHLSLSFSAGYTHFANEEGVVNTTQLGILPTYYFGDVSDDAGSLYLRGHFFWLLPWGSKAGVELGYSIVQSETWILDFGFGLFGYLKNPYQSMRGKSVLGLAGGISDVWMQISDVYPTASASFGFVF